jgi:hypothetical protein
LWSSSQAPPTSEKQLQAWRDKFQSTSYKHQLNHFRQWFSFLDEAYRHFIPQLTHAGMLQGMSLSEPEKNHFFDGDEIRGSWVYPVMKPGDTVK